MPRFFVSITASQPLTTEIVVEADDQYQAGQLAYDLALRHVGDIVWEEHREIEDIDTDLTNEADDDEPLTVFGLGRRRR